MPALAPLGIALLLTSGADAQPLPASGSPALTLGDALVEAQANSPDLAARAARLDAARARVGGATAWMPPMIGLMAENVPAGNVDPTTADMGIRVMASQTIPWPGRLQPGVEAARLGVVADEAALDAARRAIAADVAAAYVRLALVAREREVLDGQRRVLQEIADLAARRYAVGAGTQPDALRAGLERTRIETDAAALRATRAEAARALRFLLARPATSPDTLIAASPLPDVVAWLERVYAGASGDGPAPWSARPEFRVVAARRAATRARIEAVRLSRRPDITVSAEYGFVREGYGAEGMGMDMWTAGVTLTLPIAPWSDRAAQAETAAWMAEDRALAEEARGLEQRAVAEVEALREQVAAARAVTLLYERDLLPQVQTAYDAALHAYAVGAGDLTGLLDARRVLGDLVRASEVARARYAEALARAAQSLGADFSLPDAP